MHESFWLQNIFQEMHLDSVTARLYRCEKHWNMKERVISDDMFFYIIKGRGKVTVENRVHPLYPGVCAHFRRKIRHSAFHDPRNPLHVLSVHYNATVMQSLPLPELLGFPDFFLIGRDDVLKRCFREILKEADENLIGCTRAFEARVMQILLHLIRSKSYRETMRPDYYEARHNDLLRLRPALDRMLATLAEPESIEDLARLTGFSIAQFRRVFSRSLRMAPVQYLRRLRIRQACHLLRNTTQTVEDIATKVGYQEASFFAHTFKDFMDVSPGGYRHQSDL